MEGIVQYSLGLINQEVEVDILLKVNSTIRKTRKPKPRIDTPGEVLKYSGGRRYFVLCFTFFPPSHIYILRYYICLHVCGEYFIIEKNILSCACVIAIILETSSIFQKN